MPTHAFQTTLTKNGQAVLSAAFARTEENARESDFVLAATQTDYPLGLGTMVRTKIKAFAVLFDKDTTLKTNSAGTPAETWLFKANVAFLWTADQPTPCPFSVDVTNVFLTTGPAATTCKLYFLLDI